MTYFKDIGKGCKNFFSGRADVPGNVDFDLGETWSLSVNQGEQTIEGKRNKRDGFMKYTYNGFLPEKPFKGIGGNLGVKLSNKLGKDSKAGAGDAEVTSAYEVELKKLNLGGASVDVAWDGSQPAANAITVKAKYGKIKNVNIFAAYDRNTSTNGRYKKNFVANASYTKDDKVFGAQINASVDNDGSEGNENGLKGYNLAALWNRSGAKLSAELAGKEMDAPDTLTVKYDKQVRAGFACYLQGKFDKFYTQTLKNQGSGTGTNTFSIGGDFDVNDSSNLKLAVASGNSEASNSVKGVYTHKLGDNLTGSISYNSTLGKEEGGGVFSDGRIGWKLAFA